MYYRFLLMFLFPLCMYAQSSKTIRTPQSGKASVRQMVAAMTLEEKAQLVVGTGMRSMFGNGPAIGDADGKVPGAAGNTISISRLGIPGTVLADGPAGVRIDAFHKGDSSKSYYATAWPVGTLLASSWDTALIRKVGVAFGQEIQEYGVDVILAPGMNIQRDPLNGRNFEYYSEDPFVSGKLASAMVKGIQSNGVGTSIKHFAANNQETNRNNVNVIVSERALREIYLRGFEIAVKESKPWTVMSSYNKINGVYASESHDLLTKILRGEWGFKGYVMTDWFGGKDPIAQMKAGNDLVEPGNKKQTQEIIAAVHNGTLDVKVLDGNVMRILNVLVQSPAFQKYKYSNQPDLKAHATLARAAAVESMVLLKNQQHVLPLQKGLKLALFGNASYETSIGGTGSGDVNEAYSVSITEGLTKAGYTPLNDLQSKYSLHIQQDKLAHPKPKMITIGAVRMTPELEFTTDDIHISADEADVAVYTIGRNAGEGSDRKVEGDFTLSQAEQNLLKNVADAFHVKGKKLIVILNIGGVIETASWREHADAILLPWQPGQEGGSAIADVISGKVNPSGKLATTFPMKYEDTPSAKNFPGTPTQKPEEVKYEEGIYVGYRYHNSFGVKPAYAFGYGLSYTEFSYSNLKLSSSTFTGKLIATVTITNKGKLPGKEIVQLYVRAPQSTLDKPSEELKGFAKTKLLQPGASQTITFELKAKDLASFHTDQSAWIVDTGTYTVRLGASSEDIKVTKTFNVVNDIVVEKVNKALVPQVHINELKPNKKSTLNK